MERHQDLNRFCNDFARQWYPPGWEQPSMGFLYPDQFERLWWPADLVGRHLLFDDNRLNYVFQVLPMAGWLIEKRLLNKPEYLEYDQAASSNHVDEETYVMNHPLYVNIRSVFEARSVGRGLGSQYCVFQRARPLVLDMLHGDNGQLPARYANLIAQPPNPEGSEEPPEENHLQTFHLFNDLPYELRRYVWELFCPDLVTPARLLHFDQWRCPVETSLSYIGPNLKETIGTSALRTLLSIHSETRKITRSKFPDALRFVATDSRWGHRYLAGHPAQLPFNKERDIVCVECLDSYNDRNSESPCDPHAQALGEVLYDFCSQVRHLAIRGGVADGGHRVNVSLHLAWFAADIAHLFPNLKTLYILSRYRSRHLHWATTPHVRRLASQTGPWIYAWPKSSSGPDYDALKVPPIVEEMTATVNEYARAPPSWIGLKTQVEPHDWDALPIAEIAEGDYPWIVKDTEEQLQKYGDLGYESDESQESRVRKWNKNAEHVLINRMSEATGLEQFSRKSWEEFKRIHNNR